MRVQARGNGRIFRGATEHVGKTDTNANLERPEKCLLVLKSDGAPDSRRLPDHHPRAR